MIKSGKHCIHALLFALLICVSPVLAYDANIVKDFKVEGNRLIASEVILLNVKMKSGDKLENRLENGHHRI